MGREILINYSEVYSKTAELKSYIDSELMVRLNNEYQHIQSILDGVDGATNASLKSAMELKLKKSVAVAKTLDKLLTFMATSSKEIEMQEKEIADVFAAVKAPVKGGVAECQTDSSVTHVKST